MSWRKRVHRTLEWKVSGQESGERVAIRRQRPKERHVWKIEGKSLWLTARWGYKAAKGRAAEPIIKIIGLIWHPWWKSSGDLGGELGREREVRSPKADSKLEDETRLLIWTKIIKNIFGGRCPGLVFTQQYCLWFILFCFVLQDERGVSLSC